MRRRITILRALLLAGAALAVLNAGCGQYSDASDPDPHYFKGKHFVHKRTA